MILSENINIKINASNFDYYKLYYNNIKCGNEINIPIKILYKNSKTKIHVKCDICGIEKYLSFYSYNNNIKNGGYYSCSKKCSIDKYKNTCYEKYGVDNPSKNDDVKNKIKKTVNEKYGKNYIFEVDFVKEKIKQKNKYKYGVEYPMQNKDILEKSYKTCKEKYGEYRPSMNENVKKKISEKIKDCYKNKSFELYNNLINKNGNVIHINCDKGHIYESNIKLYSSRKQLKIKQCTICNPIKSTSSNYEDEIYNFIKKNINERVLKSVKNIIPPYEIDIYIPDLKLAFEFNGLYWHSNLKKDKNYHLIKTEKCENKKIKLFHIYEDEWLFKQDIIKSMILEKLNKLNKLVDSKECDVIEIKNIKLVKDFLNQNNIYEFKKSKIKLGLYYNNELISLMIFSNNKILRFSNKINIEVKNAENKLINYFVSNYKPKTLTIEINRSWDNIELYEKLGFQIKNKCNPRYSYFKNKKRIKNGTYKIYNSGYYILTYSF